jgi:hypothetical protein
MTLPTLTDESLIASSIKGLETRPEEISDERARWYPSAKCCGESTYSGVLGLQSQQLLGLNHGVVLIKRCSSRVGVVAQQLSSIDLCRFIIALELVRSSLAPSFLRVPCYGDGLQWC